MYISNFLGQNAPLVVTSYVAGEAVSKGQVATLGADSLVYYALDPSVPGASIRPVVNTAAQYFPEIALSSTVGTTALTSAGSQASVVASAALSNGDFVLAWQDYVTGNVEFQIFSPLGVVVTGVTSVSVGQGSQAGNSIQLVAIPAGGFFILFASLVASTYYVKFASFTNQGIAAIPPTTVDSVVTGGGYGMLGIAAQLLSGGNLAIASAVYGSTAATSVSRYAVYSSTGAVVSAAATLAPNATTASPAGYPPYPLIAVTALSGGGFVVAYQLWAVGAYFQRFNAAGALQGAATLVFGSSSASLWLYATALTGGGFAIVALSGADAKNYVYVYTAAGALLSSVSVTANASTECIAFSIAPTPDGGLVYGAVNQTAAGTSGTVNVGKVSASGALVGNSPVALVPSAKVWSTLSFVGIAPLPDGSVFLTYPDSATGLLGCATVNTGFTGLQIPPTNVATNGGINPSFIAGCPLLVLPNPIRASAPIIMVPLGVQESGSPNSFGFTCLLESIQPYTPLGVHIASAAQGATTSIQYTGIASLATGFLQPYNVNAQGNGTPGVKMSVVGNTASLSGIQAPASQRAIN